MFFGSDHGPDRAVWHTPGSSRIEVWRRVAEMIRAEIGDALWLGCGCPLWASIGLVDAIRVSQDVGVDGRGRLSAQSLINDLAMRNFAHHILWQQDPDFILLRSHHHNLTDAEVRSLALYAGMSGGVMMTSDDLQELSKDRLWLWKLILGMGSHACNFPSLGASATTFDRVLPHCPSNLISHAARLVDPVIVQVKPQINSTSAFSAVFVFNTGEYAVERSLRFKSLGLSSRLYTCDWLNGQCSAEPMENISLTLESHDGALLILSETPFASSKLPS